MGDRVAVLRDGVLQQVAVPRELYDRPTNVFVATFIGSPSMNLYEAGLEISGEAATITFGSQRLELPAPVVKRTGGLAEFHGRPVILGIRPEHLFDPAVAGTVPEEGASLTAQVEYVEVLGSEQLVHFTTDARRVRDETELYGQDAGAVDQGEIVAASVAEGVARIDPRARIQAREQTVFGVDVERLHFFDPGTGLTIGHAAGGTPDD